MRLLVLGGSGPDRTETAIVRAARSLGHPCLLLDPARWRRRLGPLAAPLVRQVADAFGPELVLLTRHAIGGGEPALRQLLGRRRSAFWFFDASVPLPEEAVRLARLADTTFTTCVFQLEAFERAGAAEVRHLPQGADPVRDRPCGQARRRFHCDVSFVGSGQFSRRHEILRAVGGAARLHVRGPGWGEAAGLPIVGGAVRGRAFPEVVRGAAISLGINSTTLPPTERGGATSDRLWRVLACGGFYLGEHVPGVESYAADGVHAAWYRDTDQAVALVGAFLADPERRMRLAAAGRTHVLAHHTYAHRLPLLLEGRSYTNT
jgi:glycosyl transferase family 1/uncharacterized protein DUF3880